VLLAQEVERAHLVHLVHLVQRALLEQGVSGEAAEWVDQ
jgi:hypothetical protein